MKLGFVTCVKLGLSCIEAIYARGGSLDLLVTLPDCKGASKSGRVFLDEFAADHSVSLMKSEHINSIEVVQRIADLDWLFIIGWSQIAGSNVLNAPGNGVIGMHPTLLPEGRGRAAIPWAIIKGLDRTGVTAFKLDDGVDTGPVIEQRVIPLSVNVTATELYEKVSQAHVDLMCSVYSSIEMHSIRLTPQDESLASTWPGRTPEDGRIDQGLSVYDAERLVRAVTRPYPGAFFLSANGRKTIVWKADVSLERPNGEHLAFDDGYLVLLETETI